MISYFRLFFVHLYPPATNTFIFYRFAILCLTNISWLSSNFFLHFCCCCRHYRLNIQDTHSGTHTRTNLMMTFFISKDLYHKVVRSLTVCHLPFSSSSSFRCRFFYSPFSVHSPHHFYFQDFIRNVPPDKFLANYLINIRTNFSPCKRVYVY